ncbi:MAG: Spx/MgsR family RNA polymerase-binding regulatory protein [Ferruginibacter sp.]
MAAVIVYGIPNCDTTQKALALLKKHTTEFSFHDYKQEGVTTQKLEEWCAKAGWEMILNKRSTTWRELEENEQKKITNQPAAIKLMIKNNSIIKRPVIEINGDLLIGFNETEIIKQLKLNT